VKKSGSVRWIGRSVYILGDEKCIKTSSTKPERERHLRRLGRVWEANIKTDLQETGFEVVDFIYLAQDTVHGRFL
jgi:hypothetical protein